MITGVHISSSEMVISKDGSKKSSLPQFIKNQIVKAKVVGLTSDGRAQLSVNGKIVTAKTAMMLTPGEEVQLKVMQDKDAVILKLIGPGKQITSNHISSVLKFISKSDALPDISSNRFPRLTELLTQISIQSDKADDNFLPRLLEKSGLLLEKNIAQIVQSDKAPLDIKSSMNAIANQDVKGNMLKEIFNAGSNRADAIKAVVTFTETLESFQALNHQSADSGRYILPFPVFSDSAFRFGQLLIDTGNAGKASDKDQDRVINISFLLDMSRLGPLRADFSIFKQDISGRFLLCDQDTCSYMESLIPGLVNQLSDREYHVRQIHCSVAEKEEIKASNLIETLLENSNDQVLNIVV